MSVSGSACAAQLVTSASSALRDNLLATRIPPRHSGDSPTCETDSAFGSLIVEEKLRRIRVNPSLAGTVVGVCIRMAVPGQATAVTESTRFAGPPLTLRPWRVTQRRRRRGGWPWPEGYFRPSVAPAEKNTERMSRTEAIARADRSAAGAGDEDGVRRAAPDSAAGPGATLEPAAGVFTRGLRAIAAFRRCRPRTGR